MTMIADDYAAIRSHMFGDDSFLPKKKVEPVLKVKPANQELEIALKELLADEFPGYTIYGLDQANPGSDKTIFWRIINARQCGKSYLSNAIQEAFHVVERNGEVREDDG